MPGGRALEISSRNSVIGSRAVLTYPFVGRSDFVKGDIVKSCPRAFDDCYSAQFDNLVVAWRYWFLALWPDI